MTRWLRGVALGVSVLAAPGAGSIPARNARQPEPSARFDALVGEIAALREDLARLEGREQGILDRIERLDVETTLHSRELERIAIEKDRATRQEHELRAELGSMESSVESQERALGRHLRRVYTAGRGRGIRILVAMEDPAEALRGLAYLDAMARHQANALEDLEDGRRDLVSLEASVRAQSAGLEDLSRRERQKAVELESVRGKAAALLRAIREEASTHRSAIAELTRAAEALETAIVQGLDGAATPVALDIGALKGVLDWPIRGRVAVPFGEVRHPEFGTRTPHPGFDIEADPGAPVGAVLGGIVVYSDRFTGYGNTVLLDHGSGYISVYARLGDRIVATGDEVLPKQTIGHAGPGPVDGGRPTVYFEFRSEGKAVDPADWLKRNQEKRRGRGR